jgi:hypothetical protein
LGFREITVKRYKTVFAFDCERGHRNNFFQHYALTNSRDEAYRQSFEAAKKAACKWCPAAPTGAMRLLGIEEVSLHPRYFCLGYVCDCGERVAVLKSETEHSIDIPDTVEGECSKGHKRTIQNREIPSLLRWDEETN